MLTAIERQARPELSADFARFFQVHDYRSLPARRVADWAMVLLRDSETWTHKAMNPDWRWERLETHLLARIADSLTWLQWAKTKDGAKGRRMPDPIPRPGVEGYGRSKRGKFEGVISRPLDEVKRLLSLPRKVSKQNG